MALRDLLAAEWESECATSRRVLQRLPDERLDWKPHARSPSVAGLAAHLVNITEWGAFTLTLDAFDLQPPGAPPHEPETATSRAALLARFDAACEAGQRAFAGLSDEASAQPWSLQLGGKSFRTWPRYTALRSFVINHAIHHRGHLQLYLRLMDLPVPPVYGPTADETSP